MAHFAQLDENNNVIQVIVVNNDVLNNLSFPESEPLGIEFCKTLLGSETRWAQTSYNSNFRSNYAASGYVFDSSIGEHGAFIPPEPSSPGDGYILDTNTGKWISQTFIDNQINTEPQVI